MFFLKHGTKIFLPTWPGLSCLERPSLTKIIPSGTMFMNPSSILNAWRSLQRLNVDIAARKTDFKVKCFSETLEIGSKSLLVKKTRIFPKSHSGTNLFSGGLVLKIPFKRRIMSGCWPIAIPSTGGRIADNMDLYPAIVLYFRPDWNKDERKSAHWAIEAECGLISLSLHQLLNLRNFAE